jgi:hypothetical protein
VGQKGEERWLCLVECFGLGCMDSVWISKPAMFYFSSAMQRPHQSFGLCNTLDVWVCPTRNEVIKA